MSKSSATGVALLLLIAISSCTDNKGGSPEEHYSGDVIDVHNHILFDEEAGSMNSTYKGTTDEILKLTEKTPIKYHGIITMAKKGELTQTRKNNDRIIALSKENSSFFPICSVHPEDGDSALVEMTRVSSKGVRFLKLHPNTQRFDVSSMQVANLVKKAGELNLIILFEGTSLFDADILGKYILLGISYPNTKLILTHMGGTQFSDYQIFMILNRYSWYKRNIWFDISATVFEYADSPYKENLVWTMRKIGTDRILFGSDFPIYDPKETLKSFFQLNLTPEEEKQILYNNYYSILQIKK